MAQPLNPSPPAPLQAQGILAALQQKRQRKLAIPKNIREEVMAFARSLGKKYRSQLTPERKDKILRLLTAVLPPRRRRGRPRDPMVTRAMRLRGSFRRKYPHEKPRQTWDRICVALISGYDGLPEWEHLAAREDLQARVKSRVDLIRRKRRQKIRGEISA